MMGPEVQVIHGKDRGSRGRVVRVLPREGRIMVEGVARAKKHSRPSGSERQASLIAAAASLFARKGFNGTTTKEIAKAAGVSEALVFKHFPTKQALYAAILAEKVTVNELLEAVEAFARRRDDRNVFVGQWELENAAGTLRPGMRGTALIYGPRRPLAWPLVRGLIESALRTIGW